MSGASAAIVTSTLLRSQRDLVQKFESEQALSPERAIPQGRLGRVDGAMFERLARAGVLVSTGDDRWYLDRAAWVRAQSRRNTRLIVAAVVIVVAALGFLALWLPR